MELELTDHVCQRYIERFNQNLASISDVKDRLTRAKICIKQMVESAHYVSDDNRGILLYSRTHNCNFIIRNRRLITLYSPGTKIKLREDKRKRSCHTEPVEVWRERNKGNDFRRN